MRFSNVCIEAVARHLPDNVVTSQDLEHRMGPLYERLKLPVGRLELMSGIRERRFWDEGVLPSEVGAIAGEKVIEKSGIDRSRIGCLISASVCRDFLEPATASVVHNKLRLPGNTQVFDISNACLGVLNGMVHIANMIELRHIEAGLAVAGDAETLMKEGCRLAGETWSAFKSTLNWKNEDIDRVFCHQVGTMHRKLLYETIGLSLDKDFSTLEILGNTGAASLPATLAMGEEKGVLPSGAKAALLGIGSGLNCLMLGVEW